MKKLIVVLMIILFQISGAYAAQQVLIVGDTWGETRSKVNDNDTEQYLHKDNTSNPHTVTPAQLSLIIGTDVLAYSTAVDATTWSDGANASNVWTFDVSGTDWTMTAESGQATFSLGLSAGASGFVVDADGDTTAKSYSVTATDVGGQYSFALEDTDNGSNYGGFGIYGALAHDTIYAHPLAAPVSGQIKVSTTPGNQTMGDNSTQSVSVTTWQYPNQVIVKINSAGTYTVGTTNPLESWGGIIYATAACTITAEAVVEGMSFTVITVGAYAVSTDVNASDLQILDGVTLDDGDKATNTSTTGDKIKYTYYDSTGWYAESNGWSDGGA